MKFIFQLIGVLVVVLILVMAVLFYLGGKGLLSGKLDELINSLKSLSQQAWVEIRYFMDNAGITEDAAGLLDQGAEFLRESVEPHTTSKPGTDAVVTPTPEPTVTPIVIG
ncbi:MAG: hypothetical protein ABFC31_11190 [Clostridiaceae bacterium]